MDSRLILESGGQAGRETQLALGIYLVGRSKVCQIRPKSKSVSRRHCAIVHKPHSLLVQDLDSKHGTFINETRLEQGVLASISHGDELRVGRVRFRFGIAVSRAAESKKPVERDRALKTKEPQAVLASSSSGSALTNRHDRSAAKHHESEAGDKLGFHEGNAVSEPEYAIDDILDLIDGDASDVGNSGVALLPCAADVEVDLDNPDGDSDGDVDFAAPRSSESLSQEKPIPSYQLRQDGGVNSVPNRARTAPHKPASAVKKFKPKKATKAQKAEEKERQRKIRKLSGRTEPSLPAWLQWTESGIVGPSVAVIFAIALLSWIAYNAYLLWSFDG